MLFYQTHSYPSSIFAKKAEQVRVGLAQWGLRKRTGNQNSSISGYLLVISTIYLSWLNTIAIILSWIFFFVRQKVKNRISMYHGYHVQFLPLIKITESLFKWSCEWALWFHSSWFCSSNCMGNIKLSKYNIYDIHTSVNDFQYESE